MIRKTMVWVLFVVSVIVLIAGWYRWDQQQSQAAARVQVFDDLHLGTQFMQARDIPISKLRYSPGKQFSATENVYLGRVDEVARQEGLVDDVRLAIRAIQPACVRVGTGSGVCVDPRCLILTNAHVAKKIGERVIVIFPDGGQIIGVCIALNRKWDLALVGARVQIDGKANGELSSSKRGDVSGEVVFSKFASFPFAQIAGEPATLGAKLICIGQPASMTPGGKPTYYPRYDVSVGSVLEVGADPLGDQSELGQIRHDAWTYWGHSGSPLFDEHGHIAAMHNSWDATQGQRHAVSHQAIKQFLSEAIR